MVSALDLPSDKACWAPLGLFEVGRAEVGFFLSSEGNLGSILFSGPAQGALSMRSSPLVLLYSFTKSCICVTTALNRILNRTSAPESSLVSAAPQA